MSINICRSSLTNFYVCNNCSRANAIAFNVVLFVKFISFYLLHLCICLFVRMDPLLFTGLHLEGI
jgi:hypothetical protein